MKKVIFFLCILFATSNSNAQSFQKGTNVINAGVGFGTNLGGLGNARPAISISFEHGNWDISGPGVISLGGYLGNTGFTYKSEGYKQSWNYTIIGVRSAYHYSGLENPKLDVYGGLMLSYNIATYKAQGYDGPNNFGGGLGFSGFVGGRYFFNEKLGAFAELGYGISILNAGVAFKF